MNCCSANETNQPCCQVESVVSVDERGQMVLPKEIREKANIRPGDKVALVSFNQDGGICCIALVKVDELNKMVKQILGPVLKETIK